MRKVKEPEPDAWCEVCEKPLHCGESVLKDNRYITVAAYICLNCFYEAGRKELAEMLGGSFEEVEEKA